MASYIFGGNTGETPESIKRKREIAAALMASQTTDAPRNVGEGIYALGDIATALAARSINRKADKAESEGRAKSAEGFNRVLQSLFSPQTATRVPVDGAGGDTFARLIQAESGGNPNAVSPKGAVGLTQIMPATARDPGYGVPDIFSMAKGMDIPVTDTSDATVQALLRNPALNERFGRAYFDAMKAQHGGDERLAAAAYNAGPGAVQKAGGIPNFAETQAYVDKVAGPTAQPIPQPADGQPNIVSSLMQAYSDPYLDAGQRAILGKLLESQMDSLLPQDQYEAERKRLEIEKLKADIAKAQQGDARAKFGLNPQYGVDAEGNPVLLQLGDDAQAMQTQMPEGVRLSKEPIKLDAGTHWVLLDPITRQPVGQIPKELADAEAEKASGKGRGEAQVNYRSVMSKMTGLEKVVEQLGEIANRATYTLAGRTWDEVAKQTGYGPTEGALARSQYTAMVDNQVLPMLRDTFGAQFTVAEGESLRATLGDPNKTPEEKQAVLRAFIEQKRRNIEALEIEAGLGDAPAQGGPAPQKRLKFNPATGELE